MSTQTGGGAVSLGQAVVHGRYVLIKKLGSGSFGHVYLAYDRLSQKQFAVKIEKVEDGKDSILQRENVIYQHMGAQPGIPKMYSFAIENRQQLLVMQLLGPNLETLFRARNCRFSTKTICMLACRMVSLVERVHAKGLVHRDQKPDNYCISALHGDPPNKGALTPRRKQMFLAPIAGVEKDDSDVFLLDFGLSSSYRSVDGRHLPYQENCGTWGTTRYMSIAAHEGVRQSRRDDLESVGFVLVYFFFHGKLPWSGLDISSYRRKMRTIRSLKRKFLEDENPDAAPQKIPSALFDYLHYCRSLRFNERPDYDYCRLLFLMHLQESDQTDDGVFDWCPPRSASRAGSRPRSASTGRSDPLMAAAQRQATLRRRTRRERRSRSPSVLAQPPQQQQQESEDAPLLVTNQAQQQEDDGPQQQQQQTLRMSDVPAAELMAHTGGRVLRNTGTAQAAPVARAGGVMRDD